MDSDDMSDESDRTRNTVDDVLEQTRQNSEPLSIGSRPLISDYPTTVTPSSTGPTDNLIADDHPSRDTDVEISEDYNNERE